MVRALMIRPLTELRSQNLPRSLYLIPRATLFIRHMVNIY